MKYIVENLIIPQKKRAEINNKILYLIDNGITEENGITAADIASSYTGDGGLSGEKFEDYGNYHDYSEAKKEFEQGQFFTPYAITDFVLQCLKPDKFDIIMDLTCGHGAFINSVPQESNFFGCEIDMKSYKVAKFLYPKANIQCCDIRVYNPEIRADIIVGNPPFNLKWQIGGTTYLSQLYYTIKTSENIKPGGIMALIVPTSFLADDFSDRGMIEEVSKEWNLLCQFDIPSDTFKNIGVTDFGTKIMFFQKKSEHITDIKFNTQKITIDVLNLDSSKFIYETYIKPVIAQKEKLKNQLFIENLHDEKTKEQEQFEYKVKKMMFDIKRNPALSDKYARCAEYLYKYQNQKCPEGMKFEEWEKKKITPNKVLAYLRKVIKSEHIVEIDKIELVKTDYGLKLKPYSKKMRALLKKQYGEYRISVSINEIVSGQCVYPFDDERYKKLVDRKIKAFQNNDRSFKEMKQDKGIKRFLDKFSIHDYNKNETYKLTQKQKEDINKLLQKNYTFLQWEQGSGKTFAGIAQMVYRFQHNNIRNAFVVSTAIAINNNWQECLEAYHYDYIRINSYSDIQKIKRGQIVLITLDMLNTLQKHIKKFIRMESQKVMLVLDESDSISSQNSKRTKAVLSCFRKVRYKVCMTGTMTRNNICESYSQLELLYNNTSKKILSGYNIDGAKERIAATDAYRLVVKNIKGEFHDNNFNITLPADSCLNLKKIGNTKREDNISVYYGKPSNCSAYFVFIKGIDYTYCCRVLDGDYINYSHILEDNKAYSFEFSPKELENIAKEYSKEKGVPMYIIRNEDKLYTSVVSSSYQTADVLESVENLEMKEDFCFCVNSSFLKDAMSLFSDDKIIAYGNDKTLSSGSISSSIFFQNDEYTALVLPVRAEAEAIESRREFIKKIKR